MLTIELTASKELLSCLYTIAEQLGKTKNAKEVSETPSLVVKKTPIAKPAETKEAENQTGPQKTTSKAEAKSVLTLEQVRAAAQAKAQAGHREGIKELLTSYGAASLPALDPSKFEEFMEKLQSL